jgi:hypothetical protein
MSSDGSKRKATSVQDVRPAKRHAISHKREAADRVWVVNSFHFTHVLTRYLQIYDTLREVWRMVYVCTKSLGRLHSTECYLFLS